MTVLIALHIVLVLLNGIISGIWFGNRHVGLGLLHFALMLLWGTILYLDFAV